MLPTALQTEMDALILDLHLKFDVLTIREGVQVYMHLFLLRFIPPVLKKDSVVFEED